LISFLRLRVEKPGKGGACPCRFLRNSKAAYCFALTPIIMLSGAVDGPHETLNWVDAFIAKDRLTSHLLPAIAQVAGMVINREAV
jgi:hypothetical protein